MWINSFIFVIKVWKKWFLALVGLTFVKGTSVCEKGQTKLASVSGFLDQFLLQNRSKFDSTNHQKTLTNKIELYAKGVPNGAKIDAKTHRKLMPKLVTEKIRKIINNHVSLNGKNIEIHYKNNCF